MKIEREEGGRRKATKMHINSSDNAGEEGEEEQGQSSGGRRVTGDDCLCGQGSQRGSNDVTACVKRNK